jgi:hypothetical protein
MRQCWMLCSKVSFYAELLLAPRPIPKLEDHTLSPVCQCLFNIFATTLHIGDTSRVHNLRTRPALVAGTNLSCVKTWDFVRSSAVLRIREYCAESFRMYWHGYVLHEGITYKSRVPRTSQKTSRLLRHTAVAMRARNVLCNSYNTRPVLCARITCYVTVITE